MKSSCTDTYQSSFHLHYELHAGPLDIDISHAGEDTAILVHGGSHPHIGCTVLAIPRPSLTGDGTLSCTSSVINITGHKDEEICRILAEKACIYYGSVTVCSGGFHKDGITREDITELMTCVHNVCLQDILSEG